MEHQKVTTTCSGRTDKRAARGGNTTQMSSNDLEASTKMPVLRGSSNYVTWETTMYTFFLANDLDQYIDVAITKADDNQKKSWKRGNAKAFFHIFNNYATNCRPPC